MGLIYESAEKAKKFDAKFRLKRWRNKFKQ